jgi:hypothetical protein
MFSKFSLPVMPEAGGVRSAGYASTWLHPSKFGPQIDVAVVVYQDVVITMAITGVEPQDDHSELGKVGAAVVAHIDG